MASPLSSSYSTGDEFAMLLLSPELFVPPTTVPSAAPPTHARRRRAVTSAMLMPREDNQIEDASRCRYPSKLCNNQRVRKASGSLHRYCAYHRDKANANQKRWVDRQRGASATSPTSSSGSLSPASASASPTAASKRRWMTAAPVIPLDMKPCVSAATLSDEDWDGLLSLLAPPTKNLAPVAPHCRRQRAATALSRARVSPLG